MSRSLEIKNLDYCFSTKQEYLFRNFNLKFPSDQNVVGLVGRNGTGKTILAQLLTGLKKPTQGSILIDNIDMTKKHVSSRTKTIALSFQRSNSAFFKESVYEEIIFTLKTVLKTNTNHTGSDRQCVLDLLKKYHFSEKIDQNPFSLSGGERRILNQIILNLINPAIVIYDEPTVGLDSRAKKQLLYDIKEKTSHGKYVIIITHDLRFLLNLTEYVVVLRRDFEKGTSKVFYQGSIIEFFNKVASSSFNDVKEPDELRLYRKAYLSGDIPSTESYFTWIKSVMDQA